MNSEQVEDILWSFLYSRIYQKPTGFYSMEEMESHLKNSIPKLKNIFLSYCESGKKIAFFRSILTKREGRSIIRLKREIVKRQSPNCYTQGKVFKTGQDKEVLDKCPNSIPSS